MEDPTDFDYFTNKRNDRVYLSSSLKTKQFLPDTETGEVKEIERPFRIVSKVIDSEEDFKFIKDGKQVSLRLTPGGRQEIVAKFFEDNRGVFVLQIQKYTSETGMPHNVHFAFVNEEISILYNFLRNIAILPLEGSQSKKLDDSFVENLVLEKDQVQSLIENNTEFFNEILNSNVSKEDISQLAYRKEQLEKFEKLLTVPDFFSQEKAKLKSRGDEAVWQNFFEQNTWIFGYGLNYVFNSPLEGEKLEQVVNGSTVFDSGKRVDGLLKTRGLISSLCFAEIKTHNTPILSQTKDPYRSESWSASQELTGGIAQVHRTVQRSIEGIKTKTQIKEDNGNLTGEEVFLYQPRSFLVIGSHDEFRGDFGVNEDKYSSFELFRRSLSNPEIITFDELLERAKNIVES